MNLKAIIVEDEELPRLSLIQKINTYHPDIEIVDCYEDCDAALEMIIKLKPDMMFLDIQLAGNRTTIWLLEQLELISTIKLPFIIFTTAYTNPEFMLKAIKFSAIDYLIKPVSIIELAEAIRKVKQKVANKENEIIVSTEQIALKALCSILYIEDKDIIYFEADGNYCKLITVKDTEEVIFERLGEIEKKLFNYSNIIRAGRKFLINKNYIYKLNKKKSSCNFLSPLSNKSYIIVLSDSGFNEVQNKIS